MLSGDAAQIAFSFANVDVADQLVASGIRGLLNFAPVSLNVPQEVALNAVDLAVQLEQISFQVSLSAINKAG